MASIPSWARVGAKVVCIYRGKWGRGRGLPMWKYLQCLVTGTPICGGVYTIKEIRRSIDGDACLVLKWFRGAYPVEGFRPLKAVSLEADIEAHFKRLLDVPASHEREAA